MEEPNIDPVLDMDPATQVEILDRAVSRKWNKYTWSGLIVVGVGCLCIVVGLLVRTGDYSAGILLIGFGAIIVLVGLIRIAIGLINPLLPSDLRTRYSYRGHHHDELHDQEVIINTLRDE